MPKLHVGLGGAELMLSEMPQTDSIVYPFTPLKNFFAVTRHVPAVLNVSETDEFNSQLPSGRPVAGILKIGGRSLRPTIAFSVPGQPVEQPKSSSVLLISKNDVPFVLNPMWEPDLANPAETVNVGMAAAVAGSTDIKDPASSAAATKSDLTTTERLPS